MEINYVCYVLTVDKKFRHKLDVFFDQYFFDVTYEVIGDLTADDMLDEYGEIYDEVLEQQANYSIRFYGEQRLAKNIDKKLKNSPPEVFIEKSVENFSVEKYLNTFNEIISLTDNCVISQGKQAQDASGIGDNKVMHIILEAKRAFGTGAHDTTQLAAVLIEKYVTTSSSVIDIGCGTGILAALAAKRGANFVLAVDQDPIAVGEACEVMVSNSVADIVKVKENNLINGINIAKFNLIVANLSFDIYVKLFPVLFGKLKKNQTCIFSGIMVGQKNKFEKLLLKHHGIIIEECASDEWSAFVVRVK
ncbi:MAG: 50S ribosomal protein L11 methyltransferase [Culicoidibacterales bacterium]